jgi:octaprenyl-diphosphate synthase
MFERRFREAMRSKVPLLDRVMHYIVQRKGKQMRPAVHPAERAAVRAR